MSSTLADLLRSLPDQALTELLRTRPDLLVPAPADLTALAARVASRGSVARALDHLPRFDLEILDALRLCRDEEHHTNLEQVVALATAPAAGVDPATVRAAVGRLRDRLLVYGADEQLQVAAAVDEVLGPYPAGLGRPAAELARRYPPSAAPDIGGDAELTTALVEDPARLRRTLLSAPPAARAVLERLAAGPPVGTVEGSLAEPAEANPVSWLVRHHLLVAISPTQVELPREVGVLLRRDAGPLGPRHPTPPSPAAAPEDPTRVDAAGAGQVLELLQQVTTLLTALADEPASVLRSSGLGVRDLRRLAKTTGLDEPTTGLLLEVTYAAGLLGRTEPGRLSDEPVFRPTSMFDQWREATLPTRWHILANSWLTMPRQPGLIGQRDARDRPITPLTAEVGWPAAPVARRRVLAVLDRLPAGQAPTVDETVALVEWYAPRWATGRAPVIRQILAEAATLGVTGGGALTSYGSLLLAEAMGQPEPEPDPLGVHAGDRPAGLPRSAAQLADLLPAPVEEVLVQADLTVVVPGPPDPALAAELELVAEPESAGGAIVYRLTRDSLRRALDVGYTGEELHALFDRRSRTPVPQALRYLIDDVARSHGGLRTGGAAAYLRSDDTALVAQVLTDRRLAGLDLRRLAPTVLITGVGPGRLLAALRQAGYTPVPEDARGAAVLTRPRPVRASAGGWPPAPVDPFAAARVSTPRLLGIIEDLRLAEARRQQARRAPATLHGGAESTTPAQSHTEALAVLQQAVRDRALVWIGYVDAHGARTSRLLRPVSIGAGYLRAEDERTDTLHTFALHRITGATLES